MVGMTHEQIARHLGTAREVVTRMLRHFSSDGWIEVTRKGVKILDKTRNAKKFYFNHDGKLALNLRPNSVVYIDF